MVLPGSLGVRIGMRGKVHYYHCFAGESGCEGRDEGKVHSSAWEPGCEG